MKTIIADRDTIGLLDIDRTRAQRTGRSRVIRPYAAASAIALAAASVVPLAPNASAEPGAVLVWTEHSAVGAVADDLGNPSTSGRNDPVVMTVGGTTYAVMSDYRLDDPYGFRNLEIMLRTSSDGGRTWGQLHNISADAAVITDDSGFTALAANDFTTLAAFGTKTDGPTSGAANKLTVVTDLAGSRARQRVPVGWLAVDAAGSGASFYLAGMKWNGGYEIQVVRSSDNGQTWGEPVIVPRDGFCYGAGADVHSDVAAVGQTVVVTYAATRCGAGGSLDIYRSVSTNGGASWSAPTQLTNTPQRENAPESIVVGNTITTMWRTIRSELNRTVEMTRTNDAGATWSAPATVYSFSRSGNWYRDSHPWETPRFSSSSDELLTMYAPFSPQLLTSADHGATWVVGEAVPHNGQTVAVVHDTGRGYFAWDAADEKSWVGSYVSAPDTPATVSAPGAPANVTAGAGPSSVVSNSVTPRAAPSQVGRPRARVRGRTVVVSWPAARANGSPVTRYTVSSDKKHRKSVAGSVRSVSFSKLRPSKYRFRVVATNGMGSSPTSRWVAVRIRKPR